MKNLFIATAVTLLAVPMAAQRTVIHGDPNNPVWPPIFIAVSELVTPEGEFLPSLPWRKTMIGYGKVAMDPRDRQVDASPDLPCGGGGWTENDGETAADMSSPLAMLRSAKGIFLGRIDSITPGFFFASPGSLLELVDVRTIRGSLEYGTVQDRVWIRHPYAHFRTGALEFCSETQKETHVPTVGEQMIVFTFDAPLDHLGTLVWATLRDVVFESERGLDVPEVLRPLAGNATSLPAMADRLREMLMQGEAQRDRQ